MKSLLSLLLFVIISFYSNAQIVDIPDANFKAKLLEASPTENIAHDISGNYITIDSNGDGEIQESEALQVYSLFVGFSNISDVTGLEFFTNLTGLFLYDNNISVLPLDTLINLIGLRCDFNQITDLDFTGLNALTTVICPDNLISSLDFSDNPSFKDLYCHNNEPLTSINVKNGYVNLRIDRDWDGGNPNLEFICVDLGEEQWATSNAGYSPDININSYCSFTPSGNYNIIEGSVLFDANNNGCDSSDFPINTVGISINDGSNIGFNFTNVFGNYMFFTQAGTFEMMPTMENPSWFDFSPTSTNVSFADNLNNINTQNYCINPVGVHNDVEVIIAPIFYPQPGFDAVCHITYRNKGNQMLSGVIDFTFNDAVLDYVSASINPDMQASGNLSWNYTNLLPFESRGILVTLNLNSPMETPAVNIGDQLIFSATINPILGDEIPDDNAFTLDQEVVGSYDPNDITCLEGDTVSPDNIGEYLHYNINFENTGTAPATFVVVKDVIDETNFDLSSLQIMYASHEMQTRVVDNTIEFIFDNINLGPNEKGNVVFKIRTNNSLNTNDFVENDAEIFFDYNFPIETNLAVTSFQVLSVDDFGIDNSISVFPNPSKDIVTLTSKSNLKSIQIYDAMSRLVFETSLDDSNFTLNVSSYSEGIYFLKLKTASGEQVERFIKN